MAMCVVAGVHDVCLYVYSHVNVCLMGVCVSERKVHVDMDSAKVSLCV